MTTIANTPSVLIRIVPSIVAVLLIVSFSRFAFWQLDRAQKKIELQNAFENPGTYGQVVDGMEPPVFAAVQATGKYLGERQVLIENAILNGKLGYFVITPFVFDSGAAPILVNRGWVAKLRNGNLPDVSVSDEPRQILGKRGHLARVGVRPGEAFSAQDTWPKVAVWPTLDDIAIQFESPFQTWVLLLEPGQDDGFVRQWKPNDAGPSTHYGYALQWFAMAIVVAIIFGWRVTKGWRGERKKGSV